MKITKAVLAVALLFAVTPVFAQEVITFQDGVSPTPEYAGTQDTHIISWDNVSGQLLRHSDGSNAGDGSDPNYADNPQNMGGYHLMEEGDNGGGTNDSKVLLVQFLDLDQTIPASRAGEVSKAQIGLYFDSLRDGNDNPAHDLNVNRILKEWIQGEGASPANPGSGFDGVDAPDNSGAVTWNSTGIELWQAMGAEGPEDVAPTESTTHVDPGQVGEWIWFDVTESAQIWIGDSGQNHGVKISQNVYPDEFLEPDLVVDGKNIYSADPVAEPTVFVNARFVFRTSENDEIETRPQLEVTLGGASITPDWELFR